MEYNANHTIREHVENLYSKLELANKDISSARRVILQVYIELQNDEPDLKYCKNMLETALKRY